MGKKLNEIGIYSIEALVRTPKKDLVSIKGLSEGKVDQILREATKMVHMGFQSATTILEQRKEMIQITTGSKKFDELLDGGIETGSITEIYGEYRCGKTQLCHTLAVTCQLPVEKGGGEGKCLFIDTEGTFRPQRLVDIGERFGIDPKTCLRNVAYARAYTTDHPTALLVSASSMMAAQRFSLIIVDSATGLYRSEYNGRAELSARQIHLGRFLRAIQKIADHSGVAILVTNQVVSNIEHNNNFYTNPIKPIGGHIMAHAPATRLSITKCKDNVRRVKIVASPYLPEKVVDICICSGGIQDVNRSIVQNSS